MHDSSIRRALRRWGERVILTAIVLAGFGIGTAGLALIGERWQDDPVVLDDPAPLLDQPGVKLVLDSEPDLDLEAVPDRRHDDREHRGRRGARRR